VQLVLSPLVPAIVAMVHAFGLILARLVSQAAAGDVNSGRRAARGSATALPLVWAGERP
jgi:hypothetical protein